MTSRPADEGKEAGSWFTSITNTIRGAGDQAVDVLRDSTDHLTRKTSEFFDSSLRLAVTGLSRSGKTVFTTAVVHQLELLAQQPHLAELLGIEVLGACVEDPPSLAVPRFRYREALCRLCGHPPAWPEPTRSVSEIRVAIRYRKPKRGLFAFGSGDRILRVDIVDYPGEWLLDLPLLDKSYESWSAQTFALLDEEPRASLPEARAWQRYAAAQDPEKPPPNGDRDIQEGTALYKSYLIACRREGLQLLQPGRFVLPDDSLGKLAHAPLMSFFPLEDAAANADAASLHAELKRRFEAYKESVVKEFYSTYFTGFERQIVLVNVLGALNAGPAAFKDTQEALAELLENFRFGQNNWFTRLFRPRIDKVLFVATQADRVTRDQIGRLARLLGKMLVTTANKVGFGGVTVDQRAIAAVCCSKEAPYDDGAGPQVCIQGTRLVDGARQTVVFFDEVPDRLPDADTWEGWEFPDLAPPTASDVAAAPFDHLGMYDVMKFLLGDRL